MSKQRIKTIYLSYRDQDDLPLNQMKWVGGWKTRNARFLNKRSIYANKADGSIHTYPEDYK